MKWTYMQIMICMGRKVYLWAYKKGPLGGRDEHKHPSLPNPHSPLSLLSPLSLTPLWKKRDYLSSLSPRVSSSSSFLSFLWKTLEEGRTRLVRDLLGPRDLISRGSRGGERRKITLKVSWIPLEVAHVCNLEDPTSSWSSSLELEIVILHKVWNH